MKLKVILGLVVIIFANGCSVLKVGDLKIIDIWAQATLLAYSEKMSEHAYHIPVDRDSRLYFQVINEGDTEDSLIGGISEVSEVVEITGMDGNKIRFGPGEKIVISPRSDITIKLKNLNQDLLPAQKIKITLIFERQGQVEILVPVKLPQN
jgi:copper(I)-binding protein